MCRSLTEHSSCARAHEMLTLTATRERHETKIKSCRGYVRRLGSVQPCVRPLGAVHMTAGHNALRGSGDAMKIIAFATIRFGEFPRAMMPGLLTRSLGQEPGLSFPVPFWFILGAAMLCASHP